MVEGKVELADFLVLPARPSPLRFDRGWKNPIIDAMGDRVLRKLSQI